MRLTLCRTLAGLAAFATARAALIEETWKVEYQFIAPDGVEKLVPVVNGQFPGPTLRGRAGDDVRITVVNKLPTETTSLHWHGIKQTGTPWSDGVPGVSQCPIVPGGQFTYSFKLNDEPGTLYWHSHSGFQKSSMFGLIVIEGDEGQISATGGDVSMMLGDWYHESSSVQMAGLHQKAFRWVGSPQSLLINGKGEFDCAKTEKACNASAVTTGPEIVDVEPGKVYRLRLVGASTVTFLNYGIDAHKLTLVEAETTCLKPHTVDYIDIGPGQTYSALLHAKTREELDRVAPGHNGLFWMQTNVRHRDSGARGLAVLRYNFAKDKTKPSRKVPEDWPARSDVKWSLTFARAIRSQKRVHVPEAERRIVMLGTQNRLVDGRLAWAMNNVSYSDPVGGTPVLHSAKFGVREEIRRWVETREVPTVFNYSRTLGDAGLSIIARRESQVIKVRKDEVVEFVIQNTVTLSGSEEVHPWHLHLHNFWVMGYGDYGSTWSEFDVHNYNVHHPPARNTFNLYPGGWTAIRFKADNAGAAYFHCHILPHLVMGMSLVLQVGEGKDIPSAPVGTPLCGQVSNKVKVEEMKEKRLKKPDVYVFPLSM